MVVLGGGICRQRRESLLSCGHFLSHIVIVCFEEGRVITRQFIQSLEGIVTAELRLHEKLMQLLAKEYGAVLSLDSTQIELVASQRLGLLSEIEKLEQTRKELVTSSLGESTENLRRRILKAPLGAGVSLAERNRLITLVRDLRSVIVEVRKLSAELQSISGFGLEMVNGCISLFHAAKQVRNQVYSARGRMFESMTPRFSRSELTIRQA